MLPICTEQLSFSELREKGKYYVDKTGLVKDIIEKDMNGVYLFTRPPLFGKTTNLTMLDAFFNIKHKGNDWFDGLEISRYPQFEKHKNVYPVVHIDLSGVDTSSYDDYVSSFRQILTDVYNKHRDLYSSCMNTTRMIESHEYLESEEDDDDEKIQRAIGDLCEALAKSTGKRPIILIDSYDSAVRESMNGNWYDVMYSFLMRFLLLTINTNPFRKFVFITGVMPASRNLFSGYDVIFNNVFSEMSDRMYGFTEPEVKAMLRDAGHPEKIDEAREWYGGIIFGNTEIYNPYSILKYMSNGFKPS